MFLFTWALISVIGLFDIVLSASEAGTVTFSNKNRFLFDIDGNQIDAYGAKVNFFSGRYYIYGRSFGNDSAGDQLKAYSSVDLVNWNYESTVNASGRAHIIYNPNSKKYVLWWDNGNGYSVATSDSPVSGYSKPLTASLDPTFKGLQPADLAVESFGDQAYLAHSVLNFADPRAGSIWPPVYQTMHISPLTADWTNTTGVSYNVTSTAFDLVDQQAESPDIFMRDGMYYVATSNTCGFCSGSIGVLYRSKSFEGPWERQILSGYSCGGQVEGVLPLTDPDTGNITYVWHSTTNPGGPRIGFNGHIFQPLRFNDDGSAKELDCSEDAEWEVSFTKGDGPPDTGKFAQAIDGAAQFADYKAVCDSDLYYTLHQTWSASKTGILKEVAVNIAAGGNANNLTINVYKFSNLQDLVSPGYKYTLLASKTFKPTDLTQVFNTAIVHLNATVTKADMLGFSIGEQNGFGFVVGNYIPYCHLEYNATASGDSGRVMLEQGSGQNSPRGLDGKTSPVQVRKGKGIKFFAIVV